jgi:hypothetical protein
VTFRPAERGKQRNWKGAKNFGLEKHATQSGFYGNTPQ